MQVILIKDVEKVGRKGEVLSVKGGFGRNFLLPQRLAIAATPESLDFLETEKKHAAQRKTRKKEEARGFAQKLESLGVRIEVQVGEKDKLFGSVTAQDMVEALSHQGISLEKKQFHLAEPIRSLGKHSVTVELETGVKATLQVEVVKKS